MCVVEKSLDERIQTLQGKGSGQCARCNRALKDPVSIDRGLGPVCYSKSGGGVFDKDMEADEQEWDRRKQHLMLARTPLGNGQFEPYGPEIDLGANWTFYRPEISVLPLRGSISVRYNFDTENFEGYARIHQLPKNDPNREIVYYSGKDLRAAYRAAVSAGPMEKARYDRAVKNQRRAC